MTLSSTAELTSRASELAAALGVSFPAGDQVARTPISGGALGPVGPGSSPADVDAVAERATAAFAQWRQVPPPVRGHLVRRLGELLREHRDALGELVSIEAGKIRSEGLGEVQEMIDICEFAVGLSRQLHGLTIASERPGHRLQETWHPIGPVAIISAFNFPVAVWSWNAALALVCGDPVVWKPSDKTPLTAVACDALLRRAVADTAGSIGAPEHLHQLVLGGADVGSALVAHPAFPVVSATGSTAMGRKVGPAVANRFGRAILELGGNNAAIVAPTADLDLALRGIVFSAAGTAGQRCTTMRRLIVHRSIHDQLVDRIGKAYATLPIGDPLADGTLVGPLIDAGAFERMQAALAAAGEQGGELVVGGQRALADQAPDAYYAAPALVAMKSHSQEPGGVMQTETFAPILYAVAYDELDEALALHNSVPQGLAGSIFTNDLREAERFLAASDCGIANVNIGTSGAEIGGAFGGEKETGGGRESGSDAWKGYMRRATNTINYSTALPLAQGVNFEI